MWTKNYLTSDLNVSSPWGSFGVRSVFSPRLGKRQGGMAIVILMGAS